MWSNVVIDKFTFYCFAWTFEKAMSFMEKQFPKFQFFLKQKVQTLSRQFVKKKFHPEGKVYVAFAAGRDIKI